jgi:Asp-tRNA(Asn)/Glu-tRNA(Gln) amidotransferase A subunit family amidase
MLGAFFAHWAHTQNKRWQGFVRNCFMTTPKTRESQTVSPAYEPGYFATKTIEELGRALRSNTTTSRDLVEYALSSIKTLNSQLNGFCSIDQTGALAAADHVDKEIRSGAYRGPLHGVPVAIKDIIHVAGQKTTSGSALYADRYAEKDAEVVRLLRAAGAIVIGKTVLHEFAYGATGDRSAHGASRNPYDPTRMSGGSSGGSAVAVASGMVPLALGTDTAGSVRVPAALCGIVGFKPAYDAISTAGVYPLAASLDHVGVFTRTVEDARFAYEVLAETTIEFRDQEGVPLRVGWVVPSSVGPIDRELEEQSLETLLTVGINPERVTLHGGGALFEIFSTIQASEAYSEHVDDVARGADIIDKEVLARLKMGAEILAWKYVEANKRRDRFRAYVSSLFQTYDLLALPTVPTTAPKIDQRELMIGDVSVEVRSFLLSLANPWNMSGTPALSVPCGMLNGLPIGLQLVAPNGREVLLFSVARQIERWNAGDEMYHPMLGGRSSDWLEDER